MLFTQLLLSVSLRTPKGSVMSTVSARYVVLFELVREWVVITSTPNQRQNVFLLFSKDITYLD